MPEKIQFHEQAKGALGENEDWYRLVRPADEAAFVEHEWSYTNAYKIGEQNSGIKNISMQEFFKGNFPEGAKRALSGLLQDLAPGA